VKGLYFQATQKGYILSKKDTHLGETKEKNMKVKKERNGAATLSDLYASTCLTWEALPGV